MKSKLSSLGIILVLLTFTWVRLTLINFVPIWDGASITNCILNSLKPKFNLLELNCYHPSIGFLSFFAFLQTIDWGNQYLLGIVNIFIGLLGIYAFNKIVVYLFTTHIRPDQKVKPIHIAQTTIITMLLAFNPLFFANSLTISLDFGVTVFFLIAFYSLLYGFMFQTIIALVLLIFSKETGMILYFALLIGAVFINLKDNPKGQTILSAFKNSFVYILPLCIFATYFIYQQQVNSQTILWSSRPVLLFDLHRLSRLWADRSFTRIIQTFFLDFHWIYTSIIISFVAISFKSFFTIRSTFRSNFLWNAHKVWLIIILAFILYAFPVFALNTYTLPRYILPLIPLLILLSAFSLNKLIKTDLKRLGLLLCVLFLSTIQIFRTIDPISKFIFGTFNFGKHSMLLMTAYAHECCGIAGKDQLAYNSEFVSIHFLINKLYQEIQLTPKITLFIGNLDAAELFLPAANNLQRTFKTTEITVPTVYLTTDLGYISPDRLPKQAYFVYLPWSDNEQEELTRVNKFYAVDKRRTVDYYGYQIYYYPLTRK